MPGKGAKGCSRVAGKETEAGLGEVTRLPGVSAAETRPHTRFLRKAKHLPTTPSVPGCLWSRLGHTPSQRAHPVTTPTCGVQHPLSVVSLQEVQSNEIGKEKLGDGTYLHSIRVTLIRNYTLYMSVADVVTPISHSETH